MATFHLSWTCDNTAGTTGFRVRYRYSGDTVWTSFFLSGDTVDTAEVHGTDNRLYDFQYVNVNNDGNPASSIVQNIGINGLEPSFYPTNVTIGTEFEQLPGGDIDQYTLTIAETINPGTIIESQILYPTASGDTLLEHTFTGLTPVTSYLITITPTANQFYRTFEYTSVTTAFSLCAAPNNVTATLT